MATFEVMDLNSDSLASQQLHAEHLRKFEARKRSRGIIVPTAAEDIKARLREMGHPVTLFGETNVDRRDRLRDVIADLELGEEDLQRLQEMINQKSSASSSADGSTQQASAHVAVKHTSADTGASQSTTKPASQREAVFSSASPDLIAARKIIAEYSFARAHERIINTKQIRETEELQAQEDTRALSLYSHCKDMILNTSQYGDERPLTRLRFSPSGRFVASGSLACHVKLFDYANDMTVCGTLRGGAHTERVSCVAWCPIRTDSLSPSSSSNSSNGGVGSLLATSSGDGSCCLWNLTSETSSSSSSSSSHSESLADSDSNGTTTRMDVEIKNEFDELNNTTHNRKQQQQQQSEPVSITGNVVHTLTGHKSAVLWCDFHPMGRLVATASAGKKPSCMFFVTVNLNINISLVVIETSV